MLKAATRDLLPNKLTASELRNEPFWLAKRHVLEPETTRFTTQNGTNRNAKRHIPQTNSARHDFSCIYASMPNGQVASHISTSASTQQAGNRRRTYAAKPCENKSRATREAAGRHPTCISSKARKTLLFRTFTTKYSQKCLPIKRKYVILQA